MRPRSWDRPAAGRAPFSTSSAHSSRRPPEPSRSTIGIRSRSTPARRRSSATGTSASCFRITACCRSAPCSKMSSSRRLSPLRGRHVPARALVEQVGLAVRADHRPRRCQAASGSARHRRALIRQPRLLLCDEPTGNLDRASADNVASVLLDLHRRQRAILVIVTHSPQLASRCPIRFELEAETEACWHLKPRETRSTRNQRNHQKIFVAFVVRG